VELTSVVGRLVFCRYLRTQRCSSWYSCWVENRIKDKLWYITEVCQLRQIVEDDRGFEELPKLMVKADNAIRQKLLDLGLKATKVAKEKEKEKKIDEKNFSLIFLLPKLICLRSTRWLGQA
jgi:hypothetical protein